MVWLMIFQLYDTVKMIYIQEKLYFEFWYFPRLLLCGRVLLACWATAEAAAAPSQRNHHGEHLQPFCIHRVILYFTFSTIFYTLPEICKTLLWNGLYEMILTNYRLMLSVLSTFFFFFFGLFAISWATLEAYGGSQTRGLTGAVAASLRQSHSNTGSESCLKPTPQLTAMLDP